MRLHRAGQLEMVKLLCEHGADPEIKNNLCSFFFGLFIYFFDESLMIDILKYFRDETPAESTYFEPVKKFLEGFLNLFHHYF